MPPATRLSEAGQHPVGFVEHDDVVSPSRQPLDHGEIGSMTESEVLHNGLVEATPEHEPAVAEGSGEMPGQGCVSHQDRIPGGKRFLYQRAERRALSPPGQHDSGRLGD